MALINLIKTFKLNVIAEGVESKPEQEFLGHAGWVIWHKALI